MQPLLQLTIAGRAWEAKRRYRVKQVVVYSGSYWANATGRNSTPSDSSTDWVYVGLVEPVGDASTEKMTFYTADSDSSTATIPALIGATLLFMVLGNGTAYTDLETIDGYSFNPVTGELTITDFFIDGNKYIIYYTI